MSSEQRPANPDISSPITDLQKYPPRNWDDPRTKTTVLMLEQSGIISGMIRRNEELRERLVDFFMGDKSILVVGGESGMGKSLLVADIRHVYSQFPQAFPEEHIPKLAVVTYDRTHKAFFEEVSTEVGQTIELPQGETHLDARRIVSSVIADQVQFLRKYTDPQMRIIIEAPLISTRGETIFDELVRYRNQIQTVIMHSPESRYETLREGRLMTTSGQPASMNAIREGLLLRIIGPAGRKLSQDEQDLVIKKWWEEQVKLWNGIVVEWNPDDNRTAFNKSVTVFKSADIKPDILAPRELSQYTQRHLQSIFRMKDVDKLLRQIAA